MAKKVKKEDWEKRFDDILDGIDKTEYELKQGWWETSTGAEFGAEKKKELKSFIRQELKREKEKVIEKIDWKIICRMNKYANTPLKKRRSAYDELYEIRKDLDHLKGGK